VNSLKHNILCEINNFYINLYYANFFVAQNLKSIIHIELQNWSEPILIHILHCYIAWNFVITIQKN